MVETVRLAGVDGCARGWIVAQGELTDAGLRNLRLSFAESISEVVHRDSAFDVVAIDIPIGLPATYRRSGREADRCARALLGPRKASVFPAPPRIALRYAEDRARAYRAVDEVSEDGGRLSPFAFTLLKKIREVDQALQSAPESARCVHEVHPELIWLAMLGEPAPSKKTEVGLRIRREALAGVEMIADGEIEASALNASCQEDDLLDAKAALWTAIRIARKEAEHVPERIPQDELGLPMAMWF